MDICSISVTIKSGWFELREKKKRHQEIALSPPPSIPSLFPPAKSPRKDCVSTHWKGNPKGALSRHPPCQHWVSGFQPPEWWENKFLLLKPPAYGILLWHPQRDNTEDVPSSYNHAGCGNHWWVRSHRHSPEAESCFLFRNSSSNTSHPILRT